MVKQFRYWMYICMQLLLISYFCQDVNAYYHDIVMGVDKPWNYLGIGLGANIPSSASTSIAPCLSATIGTKINSDLGFGVFTSYYPETSTGNYLGLADNTSVNTLILAGQMNYFFAGYHFGPEVGFAMRSWNGTSSTFSSTNSLKTLLLGLGGSYDYMLNKIFSLGLEGHYLFSMDASVSNSAQGFVTLRLWL